jgi:hypothetical protein
MALLIFGKPEKSKTSLITFPNDQDEMFLTMHGIPQNAKRINRKFEFNRKAATELPVSAGNVFTLSDTESNTYLGVKNDVSENTAEFNYIKVGKNLCFANKDLFENLKESLNLDVTKNNYFKLVKPEVHENTVEGLLYFSLVLANPAEETEAPTYEKAEVKSITLVENKETLSDVDEEIVEQLEELGIELVGENEEVHIEENNEEEEQDMSDDNLSDVF